MQKFPTIKLVMVPQNEEAKSIIKWEHCDFESKHQLGGEPSFIQDEDWPRCPWCKEKMSFYGQLDSVGDDMCISDCGMIYVFFCFECNEPKAIVHSY